MKATTWEQLLYTEDEIDELCALSKDFNDDVNSNHPARNPAESFSQFVDSGSDRLIQNHASMVMRML